MRAARRSSSKIRRASRCAARCSRGCARRSICAAAPAAGGRVHDVAGGSRRGARAARAGGGGRARDGSARRSTSSRTSPRDACERRRDDRGADRARRGCGRRSRRSARSGGGTTTQRRRTRPGDEARARAEIADVVALADRLDPRRRRARACGAARGARSDADRRARPRRRCAGRRGLLRAWALRRCARRAGARVGRGGRCAGTAPARVPARCAPRSHPVATAGASISPTRSDPGCRAARAAFARAQAAVDARRETMAARVRDCDRRRSGRRRVRRAARGLRRVRCPTACTSCARRRRTGSAAIVVLVAGARCCAGTAAAKKKSVRGARSPSASRAKRTRLPMRTRALGALDRALARVAFAQRWGALRSGVRRRPHRLHRCNVRAAGRCARRARSSLHPALARPARRRRADRPEHGRQERRARDGGVLVRVRRAGRAAAGTRRLAAAARRDRVDRRRAAPKTARGCCRRTLRRSCTRARR